MGIIGLKKKIKPIKFVSTTKRHLASFGEALWIYQWESWPASTDVTVFLREIFCSCLEHIT